MFHVFAYLWFFYIKLNLGNTAISYNWCSKPPSLISEVVVHLVLSVNEQVMKTSGPWSSECEMLIEP